MASVALFDWLSLGGVVFVRRSAAFLVIALPLALGCHPASRLEGSRESGDSSGDLSKQRCQSDCLVRANAIIRARSGSEPNTSEDIDANRGLVRGGSVVSAIAAACGERRAPSPVGLSELNARLAVLCDESPDGRAQFPAVLIDSAGHLQLVLAATRIRDKPLYHLLHGKSATEHVRAGELSVTRFPQCAGRRELSRRLRNDSDGSL